MKRLVYLGAAVGIMFLSLGVVFFLAAVVTPANWPVAILFLLVGGVTFVGSLTLRMRIQDTDEDWLPIDEVGRESWFWLLVLPLLATVGLAIFQIASVDSRVVGWMVLCLSVAVATVVWRWRNITRLVLNTYQVTRTEAELRGAVRQAFEAHRAVQRLVMGVPKRRRELWLRFLQDADRTLALVISTAVRASDLKWENSPTYSTWRDRLLKAKSGLEDMAEKLTVSTSAVDLDRLTRELAEVTESLSQLDERQEGLEEVLGTK